MGDLLASWRHGQLYRYALGDGVADDALAIAGTARRTGVYHWMGVLFRSAMGSGRSDLRAGRALPGHVTGLCLGHG